MKEQLENIIKSMGFEIKRLLDDSPFIQLTENRHISWHTWGGLPLHRLGESIDTWEVYGINTSGYNNQLCLSEIECLRIVIGELVIFKNSGAK